MGQPHLFEFKSGFSDGRGSMGEKDGVVVRTMAREMLNDGVIGGI